MSRQPQSTVFDDVLLDVIVHQGASVRDLTIMHGITPDHMDEFMSYETKLFVGMAEVQQSYNEEENLSLEDDVCCD